MSAHDLRRSQRAYLRFKRIGDIAGALLGITLLIVPMFFVALLIKCTSRGPILYRQKRIGKDKKVFEIIKFRTMRDGAPEVAPSDITPEMQKAMQYRFGNFLRRTSFDEVPQLFNILVGDMSFIGPRPGAAHNEEELIRLRESYHPNAYDVRPGLSGYASLLLKRKHDPVSKARLDHEYVCKLNIWLDIKVFFKTIFGDAGKGS